MSKKIFAVIILTFSVLLMGNSAHAVPIKFSFWGNGTGTLGNISFTDEDFTIDLFADTDNITGGISKWLVGDRASFSVTGVGSGEITDTLRMFGNTVGTGLNEYYDLIDFLNTPELKFYDLASTTAVFSEISPCCASPRFFNIETDMGQLIMTRFGEVFFQAVAGRQGPGNIPEPAPLALLGIGLLCLGIVRRRRG